MAKRKPKTEPGRAPQAPPTPAIPLATPEPGSDACGVGTDGDQAMEKYLVSAQTHDERRTLGQALKRDLREWRVVMPVPCPVGAWVTGVELDDTGNCIFPLKSQRMKRREAEHLCSVMERSLRDKFVDPHQGLYPFVHFDMPTSADNDDYEDD